MKQVILQILLKISLSAVFLLSCFSCNKSAEEYSKMGSHFDSINNYKKSFRYYSLATKKDPNNSIFYVKKAEARFLMSNKINNSTFTSIIDDYNKAFTIEPNCKEAIISASKCFFKLHRYAESIREVDSCISKHPNYSNGYLFKGVMYYLKNDTVNSNKYLYKALSLGLSKVEMFKEIADFEFIEKNYIEAIKNYQMYLREGGQPMISQLCLSYWELGKQDSACYYYRNANPNSLLLKNLKNYCNK